MSNLAGRSILLGAATALALIAACGGLAALGFSIPIAAFVLSGLPLSLALHAGLPEAALQAIAPQGGAPAAVGIPLVVAFFQTAAVLSVVFYRRARR